MSLGGAGGVAAGGAGAAGTAGRPGTAGAGGARPVVVPQARRDSRTCQAAPAPSSRHLAAKGFCADPPLRIVFSGNGAPTVGTAGRIRVWNSAGTSVATVDLGASSFTTTNGGMTFNTARPVYVDGNSVVVTLPSKPLRYGQTYYVNVEAGAIRSPSGASFAVTDSSTWRFTTAAAAPSDRSHLAVALDGSAPFCSVQGALDAVPADNTSPVTITIGAGRYHDIVYFRSKNNVTLHGAESERQRSSKARTTTIINAGTKATARWSASTARTASSMRNLTIHNLTPQGGSQAEALRWRLRQMHRARRRPPQPAGHVAVEWPHLRQRTA